MINMPLIHFSFNKLESNNNTMLLFFLPHFKPIDVFKNIPKIFQ